MTFIVNAIMWILNFLFSKKSLSVATLPVKIISLSITVVSITLFLSSIVFFVNFLVVLFNNFFDLINKVNNINIGSGSAYGLSLSNLLHILLTFISASGIGPALLNALSLGFTLFFLYLAYYIPRIVSKVFSEVSTKINEQIISLNS